MQGAAGRQGVATGTHASLSQAGQGVREAVQGMGVRYNKRCIFMSINLDKHDN